MTLARPVGTAAGQVMVASIVSNDDDPQFAAPAGWTLVRDDSIPDALRQAVYLKVAGEAEPPSYSWTLSQYRRVAGGITTYAGVDTAQPLDAQAATVSADSSTAVTAPSVTTTVADTLLVQLAAINAEGALAPPAGMTERWEAASPNSSTNRDALASASDAAQPVAGATGSRTVTASQPGPRIAAVLALRPSGTAPPQPPDDPPPPPPPPADPVLVGAGDIAYCSGVGDEATAALIDRSDGAVFTTGDNAYVDATPADFTNCYGPTWGRQKARTIPAPGNHEYQTPNAAGYFGYFGPAAGDPTKGYYDTTLGAWHIIVLNSNCRFVSCAAGSPQEQWLRSVLASSTAACTAVLFHHPRFSSGQYGTSTVQPFWQALYEYGADVVLNGHDHIYERFGPQTPSGASDPAFGLSQFTIGSGGRNHHSLVGVAPNSQARNATTFGVLQLTLHAAGYDWQFVPEAGKTFTDSGSAACHGAPPGSPPPPDPDPDPVPPPVAGPITAVGSSFSGSSTTRSSVTVARPAGTAAGHVMVASIVSNDDDPAFSAPAGWTMVRNDSIPDALRQAVYVKVAGSAEPPSYTWTVSQYRRLAGGITTYAGVDTAQPVDVQAAAVSTDSGTALTAPSVTTAVADTLLVELAAISAEGTLAPPSGMSERWEAASPNSSNSRDALASASDGPQPAAGPTGPRTVVASSPGRRIAAVVALRPAP